MKKVCWFFLLIVLSQTMYGQRQADFGIFAGTSSYFGDINSSRFLYSPGPAAGVFYRYNFHPRHALRTNVYIGSLSGNDLDFSNEYQIGRAGSFSGTIGEWALQFEFNFLPYSTQGKRWNYTPYMAAGAGIVFINTAATTYEPVIPFALGFKVNIHKNMGLEAEYGFRKTFYDNFDGLEDVANIDQADDSWIHNNDWYTFAGIAFTWKFFNRMVGCPAYNDVDKKRKR